MVKLHTIEHLEKLMKEDYDAVEHYLNQVTVLEDLHHFFNDIESREEAQKFSVFLGRNQSRSLGIHPSSACKKNVCQLKLYYECTGEIEPRKSIDLRSQLIFDIGTSLHEMFQSHFQRMYGDQFKKEIPLVDKKLRIKSHADGLFTFSDYSFILEMKTIKEGGSMGWEKIQAKPLEDHVRQTHFYMHTANVPFALIFYICKNTSEIKEHAVMFNRKLWDSMINDSVKPVLDYIEGKSTALSAKTGWGCRYCSYEYDCPEKKGVTDASTWD